MANRGLGHLGGARAILRQMPTDEPFYAKDLAITIQGGSWSNLVARELVMKVGRGGPAQGRRIKWQLTNRAKRLMGAKK